MEVGIKVIKTSTSTGGGVSLSQTAIMPAVCQRGVSGKPYLIPTPERFLKTLGKPESDSAKEVMLALQDGVSVMVIPIYAYTDVEDKNSIIGEKAEALIGPAVGGTVFEAKEVGPGYNKVTVKVTASATGNTFDISCTTVEGDSEVLRGIEGVLSETQRDRINDYFRHISVPAVTTNLLAGEAYLKGGKINGTFSSGTQGTLTFSAYESGTLLDDTAIVVTEGSTASLVNIAVTLPGGKTETVSGVNALIGPAEIETINAAFTAFFILGSGTLAAGTITLAGGASETNAVTDADIIGSPAHNTGVYASAGISPESVALFNLFDGHAVAEAFDSIARENARRHYFATEKGATFDQTVSFIGASPARSADSSCLAGGLICTDPLTKTSKVFKGLGKLAGVIMRKNSVSIWESAAQERFSKLYGASDAAVRFSKAEKNALQTLGVNFTQNEGGRVEFFGTRTTVPDTNLATAYEDVADLGIYLERWLISTWSYYKGRKNGLRIVRKPFYMKLAAEMKRLEGEGAVDSWLFVGDQDLENKNAVNNTPTELNSGTWTPKLEVSAVAGLNNLQISLNISNGISLTQKQ